MDDHDDAPTKAIAAELENLRAVFRQTLESYAGRIDAEIAQVKEAVQQESQKKKIQASKLRDLRDMLTVLRTTDIKADKGRRKDLKKIDSVVGDLTMLIENW